MRKSWWKILGALLVIYALSFGMLVPLKPALPSVWPINSQTGQSLTLNIEGYNTHFGTAKNIRAWLRMGERSLLAKQVKSTSDNGLEATFDIPQYLPSKDQVVPFSLITDNEIDGWQILPEAIFIKQTAINATQGEQLWQDSPIESLHKYDGFAFPYRNILGETIRNIYYHVSLWFAMFILLTGSVFFSIRYLNKADIKDDYKANALIAVGVVYGLLGCATGSIWAKHTWGTWWTTDVKLNMAAIFMLIYLAYFVLRGSFQDEIKKAKLSAVYNIFAFATLIPLLFVIPRLVDSLHPGNGGNPGLGGEDLDNTMRMIFYPAIIGMTLMGLWMSSLKYRLEIIKEKILEQ